MSNRDESPEEPASLEVLRKRLIAMQEASSVLLKFYSISLLRFHFFEEYIIENLRDI